MKNLAIAGVLAFVLGGCAITDRIFDTAERLCRAEAVAHSTYMLVVAPRRTSAQVAKAIAFHERVRRACVEGGTIDQIRAAIEAAKAARS